PLTADELAGAVSRYAQEWEVNEQGRETLRFLLWPDLRPPLRAAYLPLLAGAVATLDPEQRRHLRLPVAVAGPAIRAQTRVALTAMRVAAGTSPAMHAARRRASGGDEAMAG
ncbi:MAG TPA: hypothetical protein VM307_14255, partial [Egibacteraceae bacterium]|nr:hypothetical protein [Egibacteraceae bacterium]